ncbi:hypothetical protein PAMP_016119 [Pampus punctatissimus]
MENRQFELQSSIAPSHRQQHRRKEGRNKEREKGKDGGKEQGEREREREGWREGTRRERKRERERRMFFSGSSCQLPAVVEAPSGVILEVGDTETNVSLSFAIFLHAEEEE